MNHILSAFIVHKPTSLEAKYIQVNQLEQWFNGRFRGLVESGCSKSIIKYDELLALLYSLKCIHLIFKYANIKKNGI